MLKRCKIHDIGKRRCICNKKIAENSYSVKHYVYFKCFMSIPTKTRASPVSIPTKKYHVRPWVGRCSHFWAEGGGYSQNRRGTKNGTRFSQCWFYPIQTGGPLRPPLVHFAKNVFLKIFRYLKVLNVR